MQDPFVSIVVPVLRDADPLEGLLVSLETVGDFEIIVADGAPGPDARMDALRARFREVRWIASAPPRGRQMNAGARVARGRWLLFLHADSVPRPGWLAELRRADRRSDAVGGAFRFALDSRKLRARLIERGVRLRVRWLGLPYGDQGVFVRREVFDRMGGFRELPLMEDVDLVRRLKRAGRMLRSDLPVVTSAVRWERDGWTRRSAMNLLLVLLFHLGVSPARLARIYHRGRS